ncbi:MAG: 3'-5'-exoribonuclease [Alectoria sarmentosa]|nr:MAG: 3'-5'-exoribonuclease [Alectoria sarmentosa]
MNGPSGGTAPPFFASSLTSKTASPTQRTRAPDELRKIFLKTGLTPSASGSAYFELEPSTPIAGSKSLASKAPALKLTCTVHGPRPLPRSAPFSPQLLLSTRIKFAPFAAQYRRGYIPDAGERDLAAHLDTTLRGVLIGERWPKSGVDVIITVLEGEEDVPWNKGQLSETGRTGGWGMMSILAGCITVASAAIVDAGIDCVDLVTGGVAAIVRQPTAPLQMYLDPCPSDHEEIFAACVIGYLQTRDEITELWTKGDIKASTDGHGANTMGFEPLVDQAMEAAVAARLVLVEAIKESTEIKVQTSRIGHPKNAAS